MQPLSNIIAGALLLVALLAAPGAAAQCTGDDLAKAVNDAGAALRKLSADNTPRLQAKMSQLKAKKKWPDAGYEERAYQELADERMAALDANANTLLARIDALGTLEPGAGPECNRLEELQAASIELQATVKTKTAYLISRIDQMLSDAPIPTLPKTRPAELKVDVKPDPAPKPPAASGWSTKTTDSSPDVAVTEAPPEPLPPSSEAEGYTIEEIKAASAGFFGQVSASLASVIEHLFSNSGRPSGYILGTEGGGAFIAGVRYGEGTLYMRTGGSRKIYWHGPSLGIDVGGAGSKTLFLIYKLQAPEELYSSFTGLDGSAYLVGGVGVTLVTNGSVVLAPIRSGVGLRLGASLGYLRFTPKATWNPF
jgi:hypothetical protein